MGRGRAKAKATKVARELKYSTRDTDFDALQRELSNGEAGLFGPRSAASDDDADEPDEYDPDEDDESWARAGR